MGTEMQEKIRIRRRASPNLSSRRGWGKRIFSDLQLRSREEDPAEDEVGEKEGPENVKDLRSEEGARRSPSAHPEEIHKTSLQADAGEGHGQTTTFGAPPIAP